MIEFLKICGFDSSDVESELPRVQRAFDKLGITAEDVERGKQRLTEYYNTELQGIQKILRLTVRETVNLALAREEGKKKIIYSFMAPVMEQIGGALMSASREVYMTVLTDLIQTIFGCIFGKIIPTLEAAEKRWLKSGAVAHCGNVKTFAGIIASELIPAPDLLITSGFLCETAPKTVNLLGELYNIPAFSVNSALDREDGELEPPKRITNLLAKSFRRLTEKIGEITGVSITDGMLRDALYARRELDNTVIKIQDLIEYSDPLPISTTYDALVRYLGRHVPFSNHDLPDAIDALNTLYEELQERVSKGVGVIEKGAPRILAFTPSHYTDPRPEHLMVQAGIATVGTAFGLCPPDGRRRSLSTSVVKDPYEAISIGTQNSLPDQPLKIRIATLIGACQRLNIDGILDRYHVGCRTIAGDAIIIEDALSKQLGVPVLIQAFDDFDPRSYDEEQFKRKLEVFKTMITSRK
jgi:hypothetical protein